MSEWNATDYAAKKNLLDVVRREADELFALADNDDRWTATTACELWQVRDIAGHLIDVTEGYFTGFEAARAGDEGDGALGLRVMASRLDDAAKTHRELTRDVALGRLRTDFAAMMSICDALSPDQWGGLTVPHKYMGPLPAFFYPVFQLMDYGVHGWDIRQGTGKAHGLDGDTADLLVPFMFILWQATADATDEPLSIGVRVSGRNGGDYAVRVGQEGMTYTQGDVDGLPALIEFDPGSLVLTTFGRINAGTIRGDRAVADRFLNSFFRI